MPYNTTDNHTLPHSDRPRPTILQTNIVTSGDKKFFLDFIENNRGRALRLTEDVHGRRNMVMIPADAIPEFITALQGIRS